MKQLKLEQALQPAFLRYLEIHDYLIQDSKNTEQPYLISHVTTPDTHHIIILEPQTGSWIIPEKLYSITVLFYSDIKEEL